MGIGTVLAAGVGLTTAAAASTGAPVLDLGTGLLTYGPLGIMVAGFMFGQLIPGPTHKRVVAENDRLRTLIDEKVWPTINDATGAMRESTEVVKEALRALPKDDLPRPRRAAREG